MDINFCDLDSLKKMAEYEKNKQLTLSGNLERESIKTVGIVVAMDVEANLFFNELKKIYPYYQKNIHLGKIYHRFATEVQDFSLVLTVCGVGTVNAAMTAQVLFEKYQVDLIIHTGIAGGLQKELKPLDIVVGTEVIYNELAGLGYNVTYPYKKDCSSTYAYRLNKYWQEQIIATIAKKKEAEENTYLNSCNYYAGLIVTSDKFVDSKAEKNLIKEKYARPLACEMEGASTAKVAYLYQKPCIIIRSISDTADENSEYDYPTFEKIASDISATVVMAFLTENFS